MNAWQHLPLRPDARVLAALLVGTAAVDFFGLLPGWWWVTLVAAVAGSLLVRGTLALGVQVLGAVLGWTGMLVLHGVAHLGELASLVGGLATGERGQGWLAFVITYATVLLLTLAGAWLGAAIRRLSPPSWRTGPTDVRVNEV